MPIKATDAEEKQIFRNKLVKPASQDDLIKGAQKTQLVGSDRNPIGTEENPISVEVTNSTLTLAEPVTVDGTITEANSTAIKTALELIDNAILGTEMQVDVITMPVVTTIDSFATRSDTYTIAASGTTVDVSTKPMQSFSMQVKGTGATATTWDVRLEGSLDGTNFTQILQHTQVSGDGTVLYLGAIDSPSLYFRSRCSGLVLGAATNIVVVILGVQG